MRPIEVYVQALIADEHAADIVQDLYLDGLIGGETARRVWLEVANGDSCTTMKARQPNTDKNNGRHKHPRRRRVDRNMDDLAQ
jgi:hypothetical protein